MGNIFEFSSRMKFCFIVSGVVVGIHCVAIIIAPDNIIRNLVWYSYRSPAPMQNEYGATHRMRTFSGHTNQHSKTQIHKA